MQLPIAHSLLCFALPTSAVVSTLNTCPRSQSAIAQRPAMPKRDEPAEEARQQGEIPSSTEQASGAAGQAAQQAEQRQNLASTPDDDDDDDDDETCGFCIFMKGGGCKNAFKNWSKCVDSERKDGGDFAADCREQTYALRECMMKNREYYAPVLEEEADFVADKEEAAKS